MTVPPAPPAPRRRGVFFLAAVALTAVQAAALWSWLRWDVRPPGESAAALLLEARRVETDLRAGRLLDWLEARPGGGTSQQPPLVPALLSVGLSLGRSLGTDPADAAVWVVGFLSIVFLSMGAYRFAFPVGGAEAGLAAAALASTVPFFLTWTRRPAPDAALAAAVVYAHGLWVATDGFTRFRRTVALGVALGVGVLVRWTFLLYVAPVIAAAAWTFFVRRKNKRRLLLGFLAAVAVAGPWYVLNATVLIPAAVAFFRTRSDAGPFPAGWFWPVFSGFPALLWPLAGGAGLLWAFLRRRRFFGRPVAWLSTGLAAVLFCPLKEARVLLPAALALPVAAAALPFHVPAVLAAGALTATAWSTWGPDSARRSVPDPSALDAIVDRVRERLPTGDSPPVLTLVARDALLNEPSLAWGFEERGLSDRIEIQTRLDRLGQFAEFLLVKTAPAGASGAGEAWEKARDEVLNPAGWFRRGFNEAGRWPLPDGTSAVLLQRSTQSVAMEGPSGLAGILPGLGDGISLEGFQGSLEPSLRYPGQSMCRLSTDRLTVGAWSIGRVQLLLDGLVLARDDAGQPRLLDLHRLELVSARWTAADAERLLAAQAPVLRDPRVRFLAENRVEVSGRCWGFPLRLRAAVATESVPGPALEARVERFSVGPVPVPVLALGPWRKRRLALSPGGRLPVRIRFPALRTVPADESSGGYLEWGAP